MSMAHTGKTRSGNQRLRSVIRRYLLVVCTVVACFGLLVSASDPATAQLMSLSPLLVLDGIFVALVMWLVVLVYTVLAVRSRRLLIPELGLLAAPILVIALTAALWSKDLPMAVRWHLSAHAFDDAAQQVSAGTDPRTFEGDRFGLYRIRGVQRLSDGIYFRTGPMANHCSEGSGFAKLFDRRPASRTSRHLSGDWYWFCRTSATVDVPDHPIGSGS
ncbi:hypothetical protein [Nocardia yamanashiensis]|uniref:hypothetical protein n=1 Tax=Nocardia yamanashiensis TaxID=209247 RepID=UPI000A5B518F|nr:hypothetical protein [Nocardia yamanashiensis]